MTRSPRAAVLGSVMVAGLMAFGTTAGAQGNGSIYTQCPGDTNGDGSVDISDATLASVRVDGSNVETTVLPETTQTTTASPASPSPTVPTVAGSRP